MARGQSIVAFVAAAKVTTIDQQSRPPADARLAPTFDVMEKSIEDLQRAMTAGEVTPRQLNGPASGG